MADETRIGAEITLENRFSREVDRVLASNRLMQESLEGSLERMQRLNSQTVRPRIEPPRTNAFTSKLESLVSHSKTVAGRITSIFSKLNPFSGMQMLIGAVGGIYAGKSVFEKTIGQAMSRETQQVMIQGMMGNDKKGNQYVDMLRNMAIQSPVLNTDDMINNSKFFISSTKNMGDLKEMWKLTEKLTAYDPTQGVEGAAFALKELFSGDGVSMSERFGISKADVNRIKTLPIKQQVKEMDKLLNKMGITDKTIKKIGKTSGSAWNQFKESANEALIKVGKPALDKAIGPFIKKLNKFMGDPKKVNGAIKFTSNLITTITKGFTETASAVGTWINKIINDPEFQKLDTIGEKFRFFLDKAGQEFNKWWDEDGNEKVSTLISKITSATATGLEAAAPQIATATMKIGGAIIDGIIQGLKNHPQGQIVAAAVLGYGVGGPAGALFAGVGMGVQKGTDWLTNKIFPGTSEAREEINNRAKNDWEKVKNFVTGGSKKAVGARRITKDNTPILAHEGERLLTKQQAKQADSKGSGGNVYTFTGDIVLHGVGGDMRKVSKEIMKHIVREIEMSGGAGA
ncbi:hypothetical protein [Bacillus massiliigorillae]|uniref:hypothetical protein n=1 Tax=Bacillus massiliigorillae TaxID=1243664 RepID=UPI0003AA60AF|nr:hypothetical protein [Bacillus massiliigorillae]